MEETIKAIYENGYFRPLEPLQIQLDEGQVVRLTIIKIEDDDNMKIHFTDNNQD